MKIHILQNSDFEGPGLLLDWAAARSLETLAVRAFLGEPMPSHVERLVILGCPQSVQEISSLDWLKRERGFVKECLPQDIKILGLCFGAQLLAHLLGAAVSKAENAEVGWHPVNFPNGRAVDLFQWHAEEFALPSGAMSLASSGACPVQGFKKGPVTAMAAHLEIDGPLVHSFINRFWSPEWAARKGVIQQPPEMISRTDAACASSRDFIFSFLDEALLNRDN